MPANLSPQYLEAEQRYRQARSTKDKIQCLQEMLSTIPKHKGTEKLQAQIKTRIAKLKQESHKKIATRREGDFLTIKKEGAGQIALVGLPNAGKSSIVSSITNASPEVADYPYATYAGTIDQVTATAPGQFQVNSSGTMAIHGREQPLSVVCDVSELGDGYSITCSFQILLSDFAIKIPKVMF